MSAKTDEASDNKPVEEVEEASVAEKEEESHPTDSPTNEYHLPADLLPPEMAEQLPKEVKKQLSVFLSGIVRGPFGQPMVDPVREKITGNHIDKVLEIAHDKSVHDYNASRLNKILIMIAFVLTILVFIFLVVYLAKQDSALFEKLITVFFSFAGGTGLGIGISDSVWKLIRRD